MRNFRSVSVHGAFRAARARVLCYDGAIKIFDAEGLVWFATAEEPQRVPGRLDRWSVDTTKGTIVMKGKCITCGGRRWWRIGYMPAAKLWELDE